MGHNAILTLRMITYILYNRATPDERMATDFAERLKKEQIEVELLDADSPKGIGLAETYDVLGRPAVMVMKSDGAPVQIWQGTEGWPLLADVAYAARQ